VTEIRTWATNQAYLAMGNLLTVCALEQIDSCPMEGFVPGGYDELLGLSSLGLTSVLVLPIGYRDQNDMFASLKKVRKEMAKSVIDIH
jgi:nitroreductase